MFCIGYGTSNAFHLNEKRFDFLYKDLIFNHTELDSK